MKPKLIEWIPIYGLIRYVERYFIRKDHDAIEEMALTYFEIYHLFVCLVILVWFLFHFGVLIIE